MAIYLTYIQRKRYILFFGFILMLLASGMTSLNYKTIYDFSANNIYGDSISLSQFKGKKMLIVNTASNCGYTGQYEDLQKLHEKYQDKLVIIGFPSNDFLNQEPGNDAIIESFCKRNYGVEFLMMSKIHVKGKEIHPIYSWLTRKAENGVIDAKVSWNFNKYLIDEKGQLVQHFKSKIKPFDEEIINWVEQN